MKIAIINGPNLNMLGKREKAIYGSNTLDAINESLHQHANESVEDIELSFFQSNIEGNIINHIHSLHKKVDGIIINPAAFTHYSVAIRDAILSIDTSIIEVHLSNIYKREEFRHKSFFSDIAIGTIAGFGENSYKYAIDAMVDFLVQNSSN